MTRLLPFRPALWPTLVTAAAVLLAFGLGTWQVQRLFWKEELIARLETRLAEPAMPPPAAFDLASHEYRRVRATGRFLHEHTIFLVGKPERGTSGVHVVTPFVVEGGPTLIINRGWVPDDRKDPRARPGSQPDGVVTIEGLIRRDAPRGYWTPPNEPARGFWFVVDTAEISAFTGIGPVPAYYVDVLRGPRMALPLGADPAIAVRNEHLQYAITWYSMCVSGIVIWWLWHRRRDREAGGA